jgi:hypothetical protein
MRSASPVTSLNWSPVVSGVLSQIGFISPQLPSLVDQPPEGEEWIHEIKHDGYRTLLVLDRGRAGLLLPATASTGAIVIAASSKRPPN